MGFFYRYAFYIEVSRSYTRSDITLSSFGKWLETVFIAIETQMWQDYYNTILRYNDSDNTDAEDIEVNTRDLGAKQIGTEYPMDEDAWRELHRAFGTMHGMTDVFTDGDQDDQLKGLDIGNNQVVFDCGWYRLSRIPKPVSRRHVRLVTIPNRCTTEHTGRSRPAIVCLYFRTGRK